MRLLHPSHNTRGGLIVSLLLFTSAFAEEPERAAPSHAAKAAKAPASRVDSPEAILARLRAGNRRFVQGKALPRHSPQERQSLARGQQPHTIIVSCSDSRVPPELIFDQGLGKLFVVREAGNGADPAGLASIEYAVEHLGARFIVVMGHESCGAVKAALSTPAGTSTGSPHIDGLLTGIQDNLAGTKLADSDKVDPKARTAVRANVEAVTRYLTQRSTLLQHKVEAGELSIVSAVYALDTGEVDFWNTGKPRPGAALDSKGE